MVTEVPASKKKYFIAVAIVAVILAIAGKIFLEVASAAVADVYDEAYYLKKNPDIAEELSSSSHAAILCHFIFHGMKEGRVASKSFDPYYYKRNNEDIAELCGDDMTQYYIHYLRQGKDEGRAASGISLVSQTLPSANFALSDERIVLNGRLTAKDAAEFTYVCRDENLLGKEAVLYELPPYAYDITQATAVQNLKLAEKGSLNFAPENAHNKYIITVTGDNSRSNWAYPTNPEILGDGIPLAMPTPSSKKGLQINLELDDIKELDPSFVFINVLVSDFIDTTKKYNSYVYEHGGKEYYFNKDTVDFYDQYISALNRQGFIVCAGFISKFREDVPGLYYPHIDKDTNATFYALNTASKEGYELMEALFSFITARYNGTASAHGLIAKWMVGNEVNDSAVYNHLGELPRLQYVEEYARTFRLVYNAVKKNCPGAKVYATLEPWWNLPEHDMIFSGRNFLTDFNAVMRQEGNIDWGVAYHAYSYPLSDPKVLNDATATLGDDGKNLTDPTHFAVDNVDTIMITMKNLDVLINFLQQADFLNPEQKVRSIILSEQGYTSNSVLYGACEAEQAASLTYAYYKAEMNKYIDAFIYFLQTDDNNASLGNAYYQFGLQSTPDGKKHRKLSYDVYRVMDTKNSLTELDFIKNILKIKSWGDVIPDFSEDVFLALKDPKDTGLGKGNDRSDISAAEVENIAPQAYTGFECLPDVAVTFSGRKLQNDVDYDVVYQDNIEPGKGRAIIIGLGQFTGLKEVSFEICQEKCR